MIGLRILEISCQFSKNLFWYTSATCEPCTGGQSQFKIPPTYGEAHTQNTDDMRQSTSVPSEKNPQISQLSTVHEVEQSINGTHMTCPSSP
jgi:hypothetical protein